MLIYDMRSSVDVSACGFMPCAEGIGFVSFLCFVVKLLYLYKVNSNYTWGVENQVEFSLNRNVLILENRKICAFISIIRR